MTVRSHVRDLAAALDCAKDLVLDICRCGHLDSEHVYMRDAKGHTRTKRCATDDTDCKCRAFYPAPLRVELEK